MKINYAILHYTSFIFFILIIYIIKNYKIIYKQLYYKLFIYFYFNININQIKCVINS